MDPSSYFFQLGVLGVVFILVLTRQLVPGWFYNEVKKERDYYKSAYEMERQRASIAEQVADTGTKALTALSQVAQEQHDMAVRERDLSVRERDVYSATIRQGLTGGQPESTPAPGEP